MTDTVEIYSPPECCVCQDRAGFYMVTQSKYYCNHHWHKVPRDEVEDEYRQRADNREGMYRDLLEASEKLIYVCRICIDPTNIKDELEAIEKAISGLKGQS